MLDSPQAFAKGEGMIDVVTNIRKRSSRGKGKTGGIDVVRHFQGFLRGLNFKMMDDGMESSLYYSQGSLYKNLVAGPPKIH